MAHPMQIFQESTPNPSKYTQLPLPLTSAVWPLQNRPYICCDGRKPEEAPSSNLKRGGQGVTEHLYTLKYLLITLSRPICL